jgi:hypothetical protein
MPGLCTIRSGTLKKSLVVAGIAVLLSSGIALSQPRVPAGACAAEIRAKCAGVEPGEGRLIACVKTHLSEFSDPCRARLAKVAAVAKACGPDVKKNCGGMRRRGRIQACIKGVLANVSDACKDALAQAVAGKR